MSILSQIFDIKFPARHHFKLYGVKWLLVLSGSRVIFHMHQAPVVQRSDNFIQWISHYPTLPICAKISVFLRVQANMHTLTTAKFGTCTKTLDNV